MQKQFDNVDNEERGVPSNLFVGIRIHHIPK